MKKQTHKNLQIELIWEPGCPNVEMARERLRGAVEHLGLDIEWQEWCSDDSQAPDYASQYGSPTILVDGQDVASKVGGKEGGNCCRLYVNEDGDFEGAPSVAAIADALDQSVDGR